MLLDHLEKAPIRAIRLPLALLHAETVPLLTLSVLAKTACEARTPSGPAGCDLGCVPAGAPSRPFARSAYGGGRGPASGDVPRRQPLQEIYRSRHHRPWNLHS